MSVITIGMWIGVGLVLTALSSWALFRFLLIPWILHRGFSRILQHSPSDSHSESEAPS